MNQTNGQSKNLKLAYNILPVKVFYLKNYFKVDNIKSCKINCILFLFKNITKVQSFEIIATELTMKKY